MLSQPGGPFIALERLDLRKYALRPALARVLLDYMLYAEHDVRRATELAGLATVTCGYEVGGGGWGWRGCCRRSCGEDDMQMYVVWVVLRKEKQGVLCAASHAAGAWHGPGPHMARALVLGPQGMPCHHACCLRCCRTGGGRLAWGSATCAWAC